MVIYFFADYIIDLLEDLGDVYTISPVIIGIFILGIDLEESIVSLIAASTGLSYLSLGNLIGNTIIAVTIAFGIPPFFLRFEFQQIPLFYYGILLIGSLSIMISMVFPTFLPLSALFNLVLFGIYGINSFKVQRKHREVSSEQRLKKQANAIEPKDKGNEEKEIRSLIPLKVIFSLIVIFFSGQALIISAEQLIIFTGLSETFFGLVVMAFVTNVEEFWLIVNSIKKNQTELGISAQIGKVLWNTTLIFGLCGIIIFDFEFEAIMTYSSILCFIILTLLVFNLIRKNLTKSSGMLYLCILLLFLGLNLSFIL